MEFQAGRGKIGISYSLLRKRFSDLFGMAPDRFLIAQRMRQRACFFPADCRSRRPAFRWHE